MQVDCFQVLSGETESVLGCSSAQQQQVWVRVLQVLVEELEEAQVAEVQIQWEVEVQMI